MNMNMVRKAISDISRPGFVTTTVVKRTKSFIQPGKHANMLAKIGFSYWAMMSGFSAPYQSLQNPTYQVAY